MYPLYDNLILVVNLFFSSEEYFYEIRLAASVARLVQRWEIIKEKEEVFKTLLFT